MGNKVIRLLVSKLVPSRLNIELDVPYGSRILRLFLSNATLRRGLAEWLVDYIVEAHAKPEQMDMMTSAINNWLRTQDEVTPLDLRRFILALFMRWKDFDHHDGITFTTKPDYSSKHYRELPFEQTIIYAIYHALSNNQPLNNARELEQQVDGLPAKDEPYLQRVINYIIGQQKLKLELKLEQTYYEFGTLVHFLLTIQNLTDETLDFRNKWGLPLRFWAKPFNVSEEENIAPLLDGKELNKDDSLILLPYTTVIIKGITRLQECNTYTINAAVYEPHYDSVALLDVVLGYGKEPERVQARMSFTV